MPDEIIMTKKLWKDRGVLRLSRTITVMENERMVFHKGRTMPIIIKKEFQLGGKR